MGSLKREKQKIDYDISLEEDPFKMNFIAIPKSISPNILMVSNDTNKVSIYESLYVELSNTKLRELNMKENIDEKEIEEEEDSETDVMKSQDLKTPHFLKMVNPLNNHKKLIKKIYNNFDKSEYAKSKLSQLTKKKMRILVVGPEQSGKSSFIKTFSYYKPSYRRVFKKGNYEITVLKQIIKNIQYQFEFIDTEGYNKDDQDWYLPLHKMIIKRFNKSNEERKSKKEFIDYQYKTDYNVILTRDSPDVIFYEQ